MKKLLALGLSALVSVPVIAQSGDTSNKHMVEFNMDGPLAALATISRSKVRGQAAENDVNWNFNVNYAYQLPMMPKLQLGTRLNYLKQAAMPGRGDAEDYGLEVGAYYNLREDLRNTPYASLFLGVGWANTYGGLEGDTKRRDELTKSTLAIGHRFGLERFGVGHVTYNPEVALQSINSTTGGAIEYRQDIQFRLLQFSVFF